MKASKYHSNRDFTNWIVYNIDDKFLRVIIKAFLIPFWTFNQLISPLVDQLDRNWFAESSGYYVLARKY